MAPEVIVSVLPFGSILVAILVTGFIVWFATSYMTNQRWKRVFWPHANMIAKQKIKEQERTIEELTEQLEACNIERTRYKKMLEAIKKIIDEQ